MKTTCDAACCAVSKPGWIFNMKDVREHVVKHSDGSCECDACSMNVFGSMNVSVKRGIRPRVEDLKPTLDPVRALEEAQDLAREIVGALEVGATPSFQDVYDLCQITLDFTTVTTRNRDPDRKEGQPRTKD